MNASECRRKHWQQKSTFAIWFNHNRFFPCLTTHAGFVNFAETWNGRLAMMGFVIGLGTELLTGQGILSQIGLG